MVVRPPPPPPIPPAPPTPVHPCWLWCQRLIRCGCSLIPMVGGGEQEGLPSDWVSPVPSECFESEAKQSTGTDTWATGNISYRAYVHSLTNVTELLSLHSQALIKYLPSATPTPPPTPTPPAVTPLERRARSSIGGREKQIEVKPEGRTTHLSNTLATSQRKLYSKRRPAQTWTHSQ